MAVTRDTSVEWEKKGVGQSKRCKVADPLNATVSAYPSKDLRKNWLDRLKNNLRVRPGLNHHILRNGSSGIGSTAAAAAGKYN